MISASVVLSLSVSFLSSLSLSFYVCHCHCHCRCAGEVELIDYSQPDGSPSPFPLLQCRNIYVLPGVPHLLERKWQVGLCLHVLCRG